MKVKTCLRNHFVGDNYSIEVLIIMRSHFHFYWWSKLTFQKLRPISLKNYSRPKLKSGFNEEWFSWQITNLMDLHSKTLISSTKHQFHEFSSVLLKKIFFFKEDTIFTLRRETGYLPFPLPWKNSWQQDEILFIDRLFACPNFHLLSWVSH